MVDILSAGERSERMSRIRSRDTAPELALRRRLHALGLRYRLHDRRLPGRPDLVLPRYRAAIFVHGCFWHRHGGCSIATTPKTNTAFWQDKFDRNVSRDARSSAALAEAGWRVFTVWECELNSGVRAASSAARVAALIRDVDQ